VCFQFHVLFIIFVTIFLGEKDVYTGTLSDLSVDHSNDGRLDLHAGGHADVEHLMIEARVDYGFGEEQSRVQVTLPDLLRSSVLCKCYQRPAGQHNIDTHLTTGPHQTIHSYKL